MEFFVPNTHTRDAAERIYRSIRGFLGEAPGQQRYSTRRVYRLRWSHNGNEHQASVGEVTGFNGEVVIAILYEFRRDLYHVCTPNRGVNRGNSILAGGSAVTFVDDFEVEGEQL